MKPELHAAYDCFELVRIGDSVPAADRTRIDVALLDMHHGSKNLGHDSLAHAVLETAQELRDELVAKRLKVRLLSYDVRGKYILPEPPRGRFQLYIGTGGPGHLDPRLNDGVRPESQKIRDSVAWEAPLFRLFDDILADRDAAIIGVCHSFGLMCRWSSVAHPELRAKKSTGMPLNRLSNEALVHPWFAQFARELPDGRHFRVMDSRLFDLILDDAGKSLPIAFEAEGSSGLTMIEFARDTTAKMPRFFGVNHHPEIIDREHVMQVLEEMRERGVEEDWYEERASTMRDLFHGEAERQSRLTSHYTLLEPIRFHLTRLLRERT